VSGPRRRSNTVADDLGLNYAAIGATASPEVLSFPPAGFFPSEFRHRIGSGAGRFDVAGRLLMTWGAMRGAGFEVQDVEAESAAASPRGTGPLYLQDGTPWITPGMTAQLACRGRAAGIDGPVKVLSVIDEPGRIGYVYGTCPGHAAQAERLFLLEHEEDDSVWFTVRSISRPVTARTPLGRARFRTAQRNAERRFVTALHPVRAA
jgi:uncharacterized protein (UPF0548 family)